jgi:sulfur-oxidizing protein SoxY
MIPIQSQPTRRIMLVTLASATAGILCSLTSSFVNAETANMEKAIHAFTKGAKLKTGRVKLDIAPLVENGNSVSVGVEVDHPMTTEAYVKRIALFNEKNPQPEVAVFHLNPRCGTSKVSTRMRLATTQHLAAVAELSDGSFWTDRFEVIVTIAACSEE